MPRDGMYPHAGPQHAPASSDHMVQPWVADHHPVHQAGRARTFKVGFRAAESSGVLVDVE